MVTHLVVMGVSGSGKSTVAQLVAERLGWTLAEGDEFHPRGNVEKMAAGTPLTDEDRWPWLATIVDWTARQDVAGHPTVVSCSALRRSYRDLLRTAPGRTVFLELSGTPELLAERMAGRTGHFMGARMLASQLDALEPLAPDEPGIVLNVTSDPKTLAAEAIIQLALDAG